MDGICPEPKLNRRFNSFFLLMTVCTLRKIERNPEA